jgi:hypothetical protein
MGFGQLDAKLTVLGARLAHTTSTVVVIVSHPYLEYGSDTLITGFHYDDKHQVVESPA